MPLLHLLRQNPVIAAGKDNASLQRRCCQLTDLVYDGVFEVLQWLLFLSAVPPVQLLTGWC
ncbi:hypothetical protein Q5581_23380, partial [Escherichia coli]|nr:hypothetical protein [Escherichia coli]MED8638046.1 hypothetical protein [Escherichia coli]